MNDQLKTALADILTKSSDAVSAGVGFLQAELPEVIHQLLVWRAVMSGLSMLISIALFSALSYGYYKIFFSAKKWEIQSRWNDLDDFPQFLFMLMTFFFFVLAVCLFLGLFSLDWLQILVTPKIYLIEYAAKLAK